MSGLSASTWIEWRGRLWRWRSGFLFVAGGLAALSVLGLYNFFRPAPPPLTAREVNDAIASALASATPPPSYSSQVYGVIRPSLVLIEVERKGKDKNGLGSGVIINQNGEILTSLHVVTATTHITLTFADGTEAIGQVVAQQPEKDIAVLVADPTPSNLPPAILGNPYAMRVGDEAFVVGNPFGLYSSMSAGVISGFERSFRPTNGQPTIEGLIQIDAAVNPGNSGGPLLNRAGQVVGIVTGLVNPTEHDVFIGIGFAVPIDVAAGAAGMPSH